MAFPLPPTAFSNSATFRVVSDSIYPDNTSLPFSANGASPYQGDIRFDPSSHELKIVFGGNSPFQDVEELFAGRTGVPFSAGAARTFVRKFRVKTITRGEFPKSILMGPNAIASCPGIPKPFSPYIPYRVEEWDYNALAVNIQCDQELNDESSTWIVTVNYSTDMPPGGPTFGNTGIGWEFSGNQVRPWDIPIVKEYDGETYTDYPISDLNGKPFIDTADRPFVSPPGVLKGDRVLTITRNELFFENRVEDYVYKVNKAMFINKYPPGYAFSFPPRAVQAWLGPIMYWKVTYKILLRKALLFANLESNSAFSPIKILNAGLYQKGNWLGVALPGTIAPISKFGHQVTSPVLLDANGLEQKTIDLVTGKLKAVYLSFDVYESADFDQLLLTGQ